MKVYLLYWRVHFVKQPHLYGIVSTKALAAEWRHEKAMRWEDKYFHAEWWFEEREVHEQLPLD
jgi:hypothetical protein